jgi:hypothetical protein
MEYISTSALANELDLKSSDLFDKLQTLGWIERKNDKWILTDLGKQKGGQIRTNPKFGEFVVWPENISIDNESQIDKSKLLNATTIGKHFKVSSQRLNLILSELGWIEKGLSGWTVTKLGKNVGGKQFEHETSGGSYVLWPDSILQNTSLVDVFTDTPIEKTIAKQVETIQEQSKSSSQTSNNFRDKFEAKHRTKDGHYVRSRAELIIDNTLYDYGLVHAYEKKVPIQEELYTDFYLPNGKVYIEFWGMESDPKYLERKKVKLEIYKKYELKLIELDDNDIANLDDHLPKKLLKFGIKVY